ncbi:DHH family phosphoesterase [Oscillospiraceae bacterium PP1C4]
MKTNTSKNLFQPILYIAIGCCAAMSLASLFFDVRLFYICASVTVACIALVVWQMYSIKKSINNFLVEMGRSLTTVQQEALVNFPIPVFVCSADGEILWCNQLAQKSVLDGQNAYSESIYTILTGVDITRRCPENGYEVDYKGRHFIAYSTRAANDHTELYMVYFFENTELKRYAHEYFETRTSIMLMLVDNYEDLQQNMKDNERTRVMGQIEYMVSKFVTENGGLMLKTERDRFMAVIEERNLRGIISSRFPLLEQIRGISNESNLVATLSVGVGRDGATLTESEQLARQALDMALGRGGDQAAVRSASGYEFFGGVSNGVEKRTKVKTRIVATALSELINSSDNVMVMGHRFSDLDCFGASVGILKAAKLMGKEAYIVIRRGKNLVGQLYEKLEENGYEKLFIEPDAAMQMVTKKTLLVICDTHTRQFLESEELFDACKSVVVIDHHRKMVGHIDNAVIFYHEPYASSASEMVTELVQYFGDKFRIGRPEAEALLAGIMLDTKNFIIKTGVRTFEAAAYLRKMGADTVEVRKLFSSSMESYQRKTKLVANAQVYKGCAIAVSSDKDAADIQVTAAQAADELLNITGVQASFLVFEINEGVSFSARSMGLVNVQIIMEKLGGGGHHTMAGAQLPDVELENAYQMLLAAIDQYFEENSRQVK